MKTTSKVEICRYCGKPIDQYLGDEEWSITDEQFDIDEKIYGVNAWYYRCDGTPSKEHKPETKENLFDALYERLL